MQTRAIQKADYDHIVRVIDDWWEGPSTALAHPIFFYELGSLSRVVEDDDGTMVGFLLGFVSEAYAPTGNGGPAIGSKVGYVHLVGIHPHFRRRGVARLLYETFEAECVTAGCSSLKAITTQGNDGSVRFHAALGWQVHDVDDYAGPGRTRIVFHKPLH